MGVNKFTALGLAATAAFGLASAAGAATVVTSTLSPDNYITPASFGATTITVGDYDLTFFNGLNGNAGNLTFPGAGTGGANAFNIATRLTLNAVTITDVIFTNVTTGFSVHANAADLTSSNGGLLVGGGVWSAVNANDAYTVEVTGKSLGPNAYISGNVTFDPAAAVPEAATWLMMVGGFGLMGASMRRRQARVTFA